MMNTTSGISPTGAITSLAFNTAVGTTLTSTFLGMGDDEGPWFVAPGPTPPPGNIGTFDSVYTVDGAAYAGAGNGMEGIEVGETVTFEWAVAASGDGLTLSVHDFLDASLNSNGYGFAVKFNGLGSEDDSDSLVLVPLPLAVWAGAIGLVGVVAIRRRTMLA